MSDTPETDFVGKSNDCDAAGFCNMMSHARQLERERDQARAISAKYRDIAERSIAYMDPSYVYREILRPELDRLREATAE